ncbi:MAG: hypothetical protein SWN10_20895 [Pseudomonadota bacterium]|nr:hypothetical protein [Pseudomonadota bacterium]
MKFEFDQEQSQGDTYATTDGTISEPTILDALSSAGIFNVEATNSGKARFSDGCDDVYALSLKKAHLIALSDEIRELANSLES